MGWASSFPEWTAIRVPRHARPARAHRALGGVVGLPTGSEPTSEVVVYKTYWEVPSNALAGEEACLIHRGVLPDPAVGSPGEPTSSAGVCRTRRVADRPAPLNRVRAVSPFVRLHERCWDTTDSAIQ